MKGYGWIAASLLGALGWMPFQAQAVSEQSIRDCQRNMNPLVVSQCIARLKSQSYRLEEIECRKDLECWGERFSERAQRNCAVGFARAAQWDPRWWSYWDEDELTHVRWRSRRDGILEYYLDNAGVRLMCAFDPELPQRVKVQYGPAVGDAGVEL
ncbi:hypothetical protein GCM10011348_40240 [Marinobacterium nitratireducens]|uniref:Uncharacterized protein n=1 Tax=Marinobacterium nitratireducens TaxID=518897 RepID=A0A918DXQ8_9GAMM|nr:hypothetical protein [Marinobacterium nitratireducens]GGO87322.1 hypothetical protein GCM10011348_40240 [Marinobacterium nitratireducens]